MSCADISSFPEPDRILTMCQRPGSAVQLRCLGLLHIQTSRDRKRITKGIHLPEPMLVPGSRHATPQGDEAVVDSQRRQRGNDNHCSVRSPTGVQSGSRTTANLAKQDISRISTGKHIVDHGLVSVYVACLTCNCWSCQMVLQWRDRGKEHGNGFPRGQEGRTLICLLFKQGTIPNAPPFPMPYTVTTRYEKHPICLSM